MKPNLDLMSELNLKEIIKNGAYIVTPEMAQEELKRRENLKYNPFKPYENKVFIMSYTTSHLIVEHNNDTWTECPCCGEYIFVDDEELNQYYDYETVSLYCPECTTIFYLEKEED